MIREVCSCGAEFETDDREAIMLVKAWRKAHKHSEKTIEAPATPFTIQSDTQVALGFQAIYDQFNDPLDE
jgi:hypothetical protein